MGQDWAGDVLAEFHHFTDAESSNPNASQSHPLPPVRIKCYSNPERKKLMEVCTNAAELLSGRAWEELWQTSAGQSFSFLPDEQESWGLGTASITCGRKLVPHQTGHGVSASFITPEPARAPALTSRRRGRQRKDIIQFWGMIPCHPKKGSFMVSPALLMAAETKGLTWPPAPFLLSVAQPLILETQFSFLYSFQKP